MSTDRIREAVLPCGHDVDFFDETTGMHYNRPERPEHGALRIVVGRCVICDTPIREFYSGEVDGPFLTRERFDPENPEHDPDR